MSQKIQNMNKTQTSIRILLISLCAVLLVACRGEDETDMPQFPETDDPDAFVAFLNQSPGIARNGADFGGVNNVEDFPEAYYNTIDPNNTRDNFDKWRIENGFLNADLSTAACDPANCITTHVKFRDTKDLGYGRNMFMRWNTITNDVAVYVENFQVDVVPGIPYGPLNFEALIADDRQWNFGVNAIEFSAFPANAGGTQFTKFYNFAGDGKRAMSASGLQQHFVDLDNRGDKPMPTPCIVCHGGHGRTLVYIDNNGVKKLAPSITEGVPGDFQAHMQSIELNTLQFADQPGFTREDNQDGIRLINAAILATYKQRESSPARVLGDWDPALAIEIAEGRYGNNINSPDAVYNANFVPLEWRGGNESLYTSTIGPNCMVCHSLRGSSLNPWLSFDRLGTFTSGIDRIDHLVYEQGKMPLGLLNYSQFWDANSTRPALLADALNLDARLDGNRAIAPGAAVAVITAPPTASGFSSSSNTVYDIPVSGKSSAFSEGLEFTWSVSPSENATINADADGRSAVLRTSVADNYTITLALNSSAGELLSSDSFAVAVEDENGSALLGTAGPTPAEKITFYGGADSVKNVLDTNCILCHAPNLNPGIPLYYLTCGDPDGKNGAEFLYRSVLARVNFDSPQDSLFLRKPSNGSTDFSLSGRGASEIMGYHAGQNAVSDDEFSRLVSWVLSGAPRGQDPAGSDC